MKKNLLLFLFLSISSSLSAQVPDLKVDLQVAPGAITGPSLVRIIVEVEEINMVNVNSTDPIVLLFPKTDPRFFFMYDPLAQIMGGIVVDNTEWQFDNTNANFYRWDYIGPTNVPFGIKHFGFIGTYDPSNTDGSRSFTFQLLSGSGGDTTKLNNFVAKNWLYFR